MIYKKCQRFPAIFRENGKTQTACTLKDWDLVPSLMGEKETKMKILAAIKVVLGILERISGFAAEAGAIQTVRELLSQLSSLGEEALARLLERMNYVSEVLTPSFLPPVEELKAFLAKSLSRLPKPAKITPLRGKWQERMLRSELKAWSKWGIEIPKALQENFLAVLNKLGKETVELLRAYGFEIVILPDLVLTQDNWPKDWVKPSNQYWERLEQGKLLLPDNSIIKKCRLPGKIVLVDPRQKPAYNGGKQRWEDDLLMEALIFQLQDEGKLPVNKTAGKGSRFYLNRNDYSGKIAELFRSVLLELGCPIQEVRLEMAPEGNTLCQYRNWPRSKDGQTDTWVWFYEYLSSVGYSLDGGYSSYGGLACVGYDRSDGRWDRNSARLLAVFEDLG